MMFRVAAAAATCLRASAASAPCVASAQKGRRKRTEAEGRAIGSLTCLGFGLGLGLGLGLGSGLGSGSRAGLVLGLVLGWC